MESQDIWILELNNNKDKQNKEIELLRCEIYNSNKYNSALIQQMKRENLVPIEMKNVPNLR